jgi:hypothetical protein
MKKPALLLLLIIGTFYLYAQNNCLNFDGTDDFVTLPNDLYSGSLQGGTELTIEYWFKGTKLSSAVRFQDGDGNYIVAGWLSSGTPYFILSNDGGTGGLPFNVNIQDGTWHHIACVWKINTAVNGFQTYVDGVLTNYRGSANVTLPAINFSDGGSWLGAINVTSPTELLNGTLDEVRIWNVARTEAQIRQNMYRELPNPASEANLVAYYKLNETGSTTSAADAKGSNDGSLINYGSQSGYWQTSPAFFGPKNCLDFDGSDDYIECGNDASITEFNNFTMEAWVKLDDATNDQKILGKFKDWDNYYILGVVAGKNYSQIMAANNEIDFQAGNVPSGVWTHLAVTFSKGNGGANGTCYGYVNGEVVYSKTDVADAAISVSNASDPFRIGLAPWDINSFKVNGQIDEVRIWSTARTASEIRENMMRTLNGNESGLAAYYTFDNTSGTTLQDFSGNGNDGALNNMDNADWVASSPFNTWLNTTSTAWNTTTNWSLGSVPASAGNVGLYDFSGGSDPVIPTGQTLNNLVVGSGVSTQVSAGENLTVTGNLYNFGNFTIASTGMGTSGTGSLIVQGEAAGNITFQRYADIISKGEKWHYLSAPVSGQSINSSWMTDNNIGFTDPAWQFFRFSELYNYWIYFDYEGSQPEIFGDETFVDARGYCLTRTSDGVLSFSGTPVTENVTYAATYTAGQGLGFNLVGNPFTSAIGVTSDATSTENFLNENAALLDDNYEALYIWDEAAGYTFGSQDYKVICNANFSGVGSELQISQDYIAPGQAFMVKVVSGGGDLVFNPNMQVHNTAAAYKSKETWPSVELTIRGNETSNTTAIGFHGEMTTGLDPSFDAAKFKGNPNLALYTKLVDDNGKDFAMQALPDQNIEDFIIPIGVDVTESGIFEFSAIQEKLDNYSLILEDRQENTFTDLKWSNYFTTINQSGTGRFFLHFKEVTAIGEIPETTEIRINAADNRIFITGTKSGNLWLSDLTGRILLKQKFAGEKNISIPVNLQTGVYVVMVQSGNEIKTEKVFIK